MINLDKGTRINKFQVRKMLAKGLVLEDVAEILNISKAEVEAVYNDVIKDNIHKLDFLENKIVTIIPLLEEQMKHYCYSDNSLAIEDDRLGRFLWQFLGQQDIPNLELGKIYVALKIFSGTESVKFYDSYKMSFRFPFLLKIKKDGYKEEFEYVLMVQDFKGWLEFPFYKMINKEEKEKFKDRLDVYHKPFDEELTREEMDEIVGYIEGYMESVTKNITEWYNEDFSHYVEAIRLRYGFKDGNFYQYEDMEEQ